jgi:hypothetical protein
LVRWHDPNPTKEIQMASTSDQLSPQAKDESGKRYGKLTVIEFAFVKHGIHWRCQCDCGKTVTVAGHHLRSGGATTCGCVHYRANGHAGSPVYKVWQQIKERCYNPKASGYKNYGGREGQAVTVCDRWMVSFLNFYEDMGERPFEGATVERIDNDAGYSPENCKWATRHEQMANARTTKTLTFNGETKCKGEWARTLGISHKTLNYRLKHWGLEKALTTATIPPNRRRVRMLTYNGETHPLGEWARRFGIHGSTLSDRLAKGWTMEQIVEHFGS